MVDRVDELLAVAEALERLALDVRRVAGEAQPAPRRKKGSVRIGQRVRITIDGPYKGRMGIVTLKRGSMFWYIRMDAVDGGVERVIYKMASSFSIINDN